jgi:hypothetical protein
MPVDGVRIGAGTGGSAISATRPIENGLPNGGGNKGKRADYGAAGTTNEEGLASGGRASGTASPRGNHDYTEGVPIAVVQAVLDERKREEEEDNKAGRGNEMMVGSWASWAGSDDVEYQITCPAYVRSLTV